MGIKTGYKFNKTALLVLCLVVQLPSLSGLSYAFTGATEIERKRVSVDALYSIPDDGCSAQSSQYSGDLLNTNSWCQPAKDFLIPFMKNQLAAENSLHLTVSSSGVLEVDINENSVKIAKNCNNPGNFADSQLIVNDINSVFGAGSAETNHAGCSAASGTGGNQGHIWFKDKNIGLYAYVKFLTFRMLMVPDPNNPKLAEGSPFSGAQTLGEMLNIYCAGSTCPNGDDLSSGDKYGSFNDKEATIGGFKTGNNTLMEDIRSALSCLAGSSDSKSYQHITLGSIPVEGLRNIKATVFDIGGDDNGIGYYYDDTFKNIGNAVVAELNNGTSMGGLNSAVGISGPKKGGPFAKIEIQYKGKSVIAEVGDKGAGDGSATLDLHAETVKLLGGDPSNWSNGVGSGEEINIFAVPIETPVTKWGSAATTTPAPNSNTSPNCNSTNTSTTTQPQTQDTSSTPCAAGTNDLGEADGYKDGQLVKIRLCSIPGFASSGTEDESVGLVRVNSVASKAFLDLFNQAVEEGVAVSAVSSFRSNDFQKTLYGDGSSGMVAKPGYSSHQMGFAIDFNLPGCNPGGKDSVGENYSGCQEQAVSPQCKNNTNPEAVVDDAIMSAASEPVWNFLNDNRGSYNLSQLCFEAWHWSYNG